MDTVTMADSTRVNGTAESIITLTYELSVIYANGSFG